MQNISSTYTLRSSAFQEHMVGVVVFHRRVLTSIRFYHWSQPLMLVSWLPHSLLLLLQEKCLFLHCHSFFCMFIVIHTFFCIPVSSSSCFLLFAQYCFIILYHISVLSVSSPASTEMIGCFIWEVKIYKLCNKIRFPFHCNVRVMFIVIYLNFSVWKHF